MIYEGVMATRGGSRPDLAKNEEDSSYLIIWICRISLYFLFLVSRHFSHMKKKIYRSSIIPIDTFFLSFSKSMKLKTQNWLMLK